MKKNYPTLKKITLLFFLLFSITAFSQTIIRSQSFDSGASGYSDDLGYTVSSSTYAAVSSTTSESSPNSLRFSNANGSDNRDSDVVFDNLDISAFLNTSVTVSFKAVGVDRSEDLYLDISYDDGVSYSDGIKLVDGDNNDNIDWGSPDPDNNSVSTNPYTFFVPAGNNQIRVRIRAINLDDNEFFYVDNIVIKGDKYCRSSGNTRFTTGIRRVQFNTINNATPSVRNAYSDFTAISTDVTQGTSYRLTVNLDTDGGYETSAMAWIDWNQDGDFFDLGEAYELGSTRNDNGPTSSSPLITIPTTALAGNTRMRISAKYREYPDLCESGFDGEVEDYTINIIASRTITTGTISPTSYCAGASVSIPFTTTGTYNTGNIFTAQLSDEIGDFSSQVTIGTLSSTAAGTISGTIPSGTVAGTGYRIRVISSNPAVTGSTNVSNLTVNATSAAPTVGIRTQPTCTVGTGSVVLNGLPEYWKLTRSPGNVTTTGTGTSTTISGLSPGTYTYSVIGANNGTGLKGEYFNSTSSVTNASNPTFPTTSPTLTRTDATVAFDWVRGNPGAPIGNDYFFVRWSGQIQPLYSQNYTFTTRSDDGVRLWVNGSLIINNWTIHAATNNTGTINLVAGVKYDIVLEFYEHDGQAVSQLSWNSASQAKEIIPQSQLFPSAICGSPASEDVVIDAQPVTPAPPKPETPTQPDCITSTGSVVLNGLPSSGSINQAGSANKSYTIIGSPMTINGLTEGTYSFTVTNDLGCTSAATTPDIKIKSGTVVTNTWRNGSWDKGLTTTDQKIVFTDNYNEDADVNGCSCLVSGSKEVTIKAGKTMKIVNDLKVLGTLTFENNASLVQINDNASNSGSIIYNRTTPKILKTDYVYWSSPVNGAALKAIQIGTLYYSFNASGNSWAGESANSDMLRGRGYIVRGAGTWFDAGDVEVTASFKGEPHNGVIPVSIVASKNNLIGNPYPSAIDGNVFLEANTDVLGGPTDVLEGTLYFWTHKSAIQLASGIDPGKAGSGSYAYTSDDYTPFTKVGGTNSVTGNIAAGQSFFARGSSTTGKQAKFFNSMRLDGNKILDNSGFLKPASASKTGKTTTANKIEKNRIWLNLTNTQGAFKQMLLGYMTGATDNYDRGYDALSFNGNSFINFYSINNTSLLTIQGRAFPIQETDTVPLGYSSTIVGDFSISIDKTDGALSTMDVFLEDKLTNTAHNLKKGAYTFTTEKGTFNDRFVLSYANRTLEVIDNIDEKKFGVLIYNKNKEIVIESSEEIIDKVLIYDFLGKQVFSNKNVNETDLKVSDLILISNQALIVKVILQNGEIITKKIIL